MLRSWIVLLTIATTPLVASAQSSDSRPAPDSSSSRPASGSRESAPKYTGPGIELEWTKEWTALSVLAPQVVRLKLPRSGGDSRDGELRLYHFGSQGAGGDDANFARWASWIEPADGKSREEATTRAVIENGNRKIRTISLVGTYTPPSFSGRRHEPEPDSRLFGAIIRTPSGPYYLRVTGPKATIDAHHARIVEMLKSAAIGSAAKPGSSAPPESQSRPASRPRRESRSEP